MKKSMNLFLFALTALVLISSCSKPKITACFKPGGKHYSIHKKKTADKVNSKVDHYTAKKEKANEQVFASTEKESITANKSNAIEVKKQAMQTSTADAPTQKQNVKNARKQMRRLMWKQMKNKMFKSKKTNAPSSDDMFVLIVLCAIFIPPLGVYLYEGAITTNFWISILLTLLFWIPGVVFALLVVFGAI